MKRTSSLCVAALGLAGCAAEPAAPVDYRTTLDELLLQDARRCDSGFEYPQALIDGLGNQLVEELRCLDDTWLTFYEPCRESGCVWADGPQPHATRPEVYDALQEAALSLDDFISITAGYRDIGMQYYSRWYKENCDASFDAAIPGESNHQGGRAIDVRYWDFWSDALLAHGFEHPIVTDNPHFELVGSAAFRAQSEELKSLSILAFQRLWNRNNPSDGIDEDGVYGASTKTRLGMSPVEGFEIGACPPGSGGIDPPADSEPDVGADVSDGGQPDVGSDAQTDAQPDAGIDSGADIGVDGNDDTGLPDRDVQTNDTPPNGHADTTDAGRADTADERTFDGGEDRPSAQPVPLYSLVSASASPNTRGCTSSRNQSAHWLWLAVLAALRRRR